MKFLKYHKTVSIISSILLIVIVFILLQFGFIKKKEKSNSNISKTSSIILIENDTSSYMNILKACVKDAADKLLLDYSFISVNDYNGSYEDTIDAALLVNPTLIIVPDDSFSEIVYNRQFNTKTNFIMINSIPHNQDKSDSTINSNVLSLMFDESDSGFIAGYACARNDYKNVEFICDQNDFNSVKYLYGFLQGMDYVSVKNNQTNYNVKITNVNFEDGDVNYSVDSSTDAVAFSGENVLNYLITSASKSQNDIPFVFCGEYGASDLVKFSSRTNLANILTKVITDFYTDKLNGGTTYYADAFEGNVLVKYDNELFSNISDDEIQDILEKIKLDEITIISDTTVSYDELDLTNIKVK